MFAANDQSFEIRRKKKENEGNQIILSLCIQHLYVVTGRYYGYDRRIIQKA